MAAQRRTATTATRQKKGSESAPSVTDAGVTDSDSEVQNPVRAAAGPRLAKDAAWRESLSERERALLEEEKVPAWTLRFHARMGHIGGAALFVAGSVAFWPLLAVLIWQLLVVFGTRIVNEVPSLVLSELGVNPTTVVTRTDSFVFSWVMPVLFFVLFLAGIAVWVTIAVVRAARRYSVRLAKGLFLGYGTGLGEDLTAMRIARSQRRAAASQRRSRREQAARAVDSVEGP